MFRAQTILSVGLLVVASQTIGTAAMQVAVAQPAKVSKQHNLYNCTGPRGRPIPVYFGLSKLRRLAWPGRTLGRRPLLFVNRSRIPGKTRVGSVFMFHSECEAFRHYLRTRRVPGARDYVAADCRA